MSETTYCERNRDVILHRAKDYYENNKGLLRGRAKNKYIELSEEEKNIKREYGRNRYHNMSEEKKKRLKEYQKKYREVKKHLHGCRYDNKGAFQNCYRKNIFYLFFY